MQTMANMSIDTSTIIAYIFSIILIYLIGRMLLIPLNLVLKLIYNALFGGVLLWIFNLGVAYIGFTIAYNPITALTAGFLGIPGVILLVLFKIFYK